MAEPLWRDGPWELLVDLRRLVAERAPAEAQTLANFQSRERMLDRRYHADSEQIAGRTASETAAVETEFAAARSAASAQFDADHGATQQEYDDARRETVGRFEAEGRAAHESLSEARWHAGAMFDAAKSNLTTRLNDIQSQLEAQWKEFEVVQHDAERVLRRRWLWWHYPDPPLAASKSTADPVAYFFGLLVVAKRQLRVLTDQPVSRWLEGLRPLNALLFVWAAALVASYWLLHAERLWVWIGLGTGLALFSCTLLGSMLYRAARRESTASYLLFRQIMLEADRAREESKVVLKATYDKQVGGLAAQRQVEMKKAEEVHATAAADLQQRRQDALAAVDQKYSRLLIAIVARRDQQIEQAQAEHDRRLAQIDHSSREDVERLERKVQRKKVEIQEAFQAQWNALAERWRNGMERFQSAVETINRTTGQMFFDWNTPEWSQWAPATQIPAAVPLGRFDVRLDQIEGGIPRDERLLPAQTEFSMPLFFPCRDRSLFALKGSGEGLLRAADAVRSVMLRMLTANPPGKVRFMIIDPVGLGENFSAFMHLADFNEQLVYSRIWTDEAHIEQRLTELTGHMENVIQVYLRNEFRTIEEYNQFAGDLAEPYRVLVVANFPAGFSDTAAARLASIVSSGARCGVYTVLSVDTKLRLPRDFHLNDLERHAVAMSWRDGQFVWEHPDFGAMPMSFCAPPPAEQFTAIVRTVGRAAKDAARVQVPFKSAMPDDREWWTGDSSASIDVPLGRAGATKLQYLRLGRGTSQHVLIAGKTGSGKSTLLHALITNLAMRYHPSEVDLYLIDFKKGVEFKAYAQGELPHARVIAIESEREFGVSVLERLDLELKQRGELFRKLNVQDLQGYRAARPGAKLPRVLLIVDEFQELFVEDDRIAQNAALLLDRLVRQGRAFGVHVLLGSQTLAGSYSLPRSTIGQMAVRIALQCSESDAHLILSEENTAARLLTRPGEAIYNDANGLFEGNHPFQVVWLPDEERERHLQEILEFSRSRGYVGPPPIVFEGNAPADPSKNQPLSELLAAPTWPEPSLSAPVWLGSAVAIKEPSSVAFARQSGNNLLLVGHQDETALGVLATCLVSLAARYAPGGTGSGLPGPRFFILDGARAETAVAGFWDRMPGIMPHDVTVASVRDAAESIAMVAAELARREEAGGDDADAPWYLIIYDLARFRDLRRSDDDFGFSRGDDDKPVSPAVQFGKILREGPSLGIHTLAWCDTYSNVNRVLDRQGLREIELRVLFQMNSADSANLIDSPAATQLGIHRAILYNEGDGRLEKFRPYGPPTDAWLAWVKERLASRMASP